VYAIHEKSKENLNKFLKQYLKNEEIIEDSITLSK
jgi:hypothetical protein